MIGQTVSHFRIVSELGAGGMGVVYRAEDTRLDRTVALKFLPPHLTANEGARARFIHEAKAASSLEHPAICSIFEIDETDDGKTFMVMPCYEGKTLEARLEEGPLAIDESMEIFRQVALGMAKAHSQGIVHRDIKPANIFLTDDGQAKILDFGLAKLTGQTKLTQEGTTLGTVAYMSPEQSRGEEVGERSDIWSLGAVLYEMLAGRPAFGGDNPHAVMYAIQQTEPVPLDETRPEISTETMTLVSRMLDKDPPRRADWESGELTAILGPVGFQRYSGPRPWYKGWRGAVAGLVAILLATVLILEFWNTRGPITAIAVLPFDNLSGDESQEYFADGMTGQLISKLGALRIFDRVISRRSVMQYKGQSMPLAEIGSDLGVQALVEGSVMMMGDRIQVTAYLLDAARDKQLWTDTFDEPVANILDIQGRIVMAIARAVRQELDPAAQERLREMGTVNPEAHKACMRGYEWLDKQSTQEELELAAEYFEKAIVADTTYALAHAGLAESLVQLTHTNEIPTPEHLARTRAVIDRALDLDCELAEAHATNAHFLWEHQFEFEEAEKEFIKAMELNPSLALNHVIYSYYLGTVGRYEDAATAAKKAIELDPSSLWMHSVLINPLILAEKYDEALAQVESTRKKFPSWDGWLGWTWTIHVYQEEWEEALALIEDLDPKDKGPLEAQLMIRPLIQLDRHDEAVLVFDANRAAAEKDTLYFNLAFSAAILGEKEVSLSYLKKLKESESPPLMLLAQLYALLDDKDHAFALLNEAYEKKVNWVTRMGWFVRIPGWSNLEDDPRYEELLIKIGIKG